MSLRIDLRPSRLLRVLQITQMALAILATALVAVQYLPALLLLVPLGMGLWSLRDTNSNPRALVLMEDDWYLVYDEHVLKADLCAEFHCKAFLQVLQFRLECSNGIVRKHVWTVILPDSASHEDRRRLRVVLRWHGFPMKSALHRRS